MVFGLFARTSTLDDDASTSKALDHPQNARLPTPTPSVASVAHPSPLRFSTALRAVLGGSTTDVTLKDSDLGTDDTARGADPAHSPAPPPPVTPSPPPLGSDDAKALHDLVLTIPPKTLHAYTLAHLRPQPSSTALGLHPPDTPRLPSPPTMTKLTTFFSTLAPPPRLHCVRCHQDFFDIENEENDRACRVPHDDESALVARVSGGVYETLWCCCGQTAPGDGSEGPPDGWCYEGRHTTDVKRARFRADSTIHDDKLTSCPKSNCRGMRDRFPRRDSNPSPSHNVGTSSPRKSNPSPTRSQGSILNPRSARKRPRKPLKDASSSDNEADAESSAGRVAKTKDKEKVGGGTGERNEDTTTTVDESKLPSKSNPKAKTKSRPISTPHLPRTTTTTTVTSLSHSGSNIALMPATKARTVTGKPKSTSRPTLSQSHTQLVSDSEGSVRLRPRTRSHVREESRGRDASRSRAAPKLTKADISGRTRRARKAAKPNSRPQTSEGEPEGATDECPESEQEERGRGRKKRRVGRD